MDEPTRQQLLARWVLTSAVIFMCGFGAGLLTGSTSHGNDAQGNEPGSSLNKALISVPNDVQSTISVIPEAA